MPLSDEEREEMRRAVEIVQEDRLAKLIRGGPQRQSDAPGTPTPRAAPAKPAAAQPGGATREFPRRRHFPPRRPAAGTTPPAAAPPATPPPAPEGGPPPRKTPPAPPASAPPAPTPPGPAGDKGRRRSGWWNTADADTEPEGGTDE